MLIITRRTVFDDLLPVQSVFAQIEFNAFCKKHYRQVCSLLVAKENQKGRRCPRGMKAPVGLLSRRPVCAANAACSARQGLRYFRGAGGGGLRLPASALCLARHSHPAGRCPNSSSLFRPLAAVVAVANQGLLALNNPKAVGLHTKNPSCFAKGFFVLRRFEVACATKRKGNSMFSC